MQLVMNDCFLRVYTDLNNNATRKSSISMAFASAMEEGDSVDDGSGKGYNFYARQNFNNPRFVETLSQSMHHVAKVFSNHTCKLTNNAVGPVLWTLLEMHTGNVSAIQKFASQVLPKSFESIRDCRNKLCHDRTVLTTRHDFSLDVHFILLLALKFVTPKCLSI